MALVFPSFGWEQLRAGAQETMKAGSPPHCGTVEAKAPRPHQPSSWACLSPLPCTSPPTFLQATGNPSCSPDFKQLLPLGQGVWEERPEARGQRSALFLPEVVRDLGKTEGGRVGPLTATLHVCELLCPSGCAWFWLLACLGIHACPCFDFYPWPEFRV